MYKKLFVGLVVAGALSVPLAGVAGADPDPDTNPGVPGNLNFPPGQRVQEFAKAPGVSVTDIARGAEFNSIGEAIKEFAPGQQP